MNNAFRRGFWGAMILATLTGWPAVLPPAPRQAEGELIRMLGSSDPEKVNDAIDQLVDHYPTSTNAVSAVGGMLKTKRYRRKAAHALGRCHAKLPLDQVEVILGFLRAYDVEEVMESLKILRALDEPDPVVKKIVSDILPLLHDPETHVLRDACRTLAVLGNKETIPFVEPLLKDSRSDVRKDARDAIEKLRARP